MITADLARGLLAATLAVWHDSAPLPGAADTSGQSHGWGQFRPSHRGQFELTRPSGHGTPPHPHAGQHPAVTDEVPLGGAGLPQGDHERIS